MTSLPVTKPLEDAGGGSADAHAAVSIRAETAMMACNRLVMCSARLVAPWTHQPGCAFRWIGAAGSRRPPNRTGPLVPEGRSHPAQCSTGAVRHETCEAGGVGAADGAIPGAADGAIPGAADGAIPGAADGATPGAADGATPGAAGAVGGAPVGRVRWPRVWVWHMMRKRSTR